MRPRAAAYKGASMLWKVIIDFNTVSVCHSYIHIKVLKKYTLWCGWFLGNRVHWFRSVLYKLAPGILTLGLVTAPLGVRAKADVRRWLFLSGRALEPWVSPCVAHRLPVRTSRSKMGPQDPAGPVTVCTRDRAELLLRPTGAAEWVRRHIMGPVACRGCHLEHPPRG